MRQNSQWGMDFAQELMREGHFSSEGISGFFFALGSGAGKVKLTVEGKRPIEFNAPKSTRYIRRADKETMLLDVGRTVTELRILYLRYLKIAENAAVVSKAAMRYVEDKEFLDFISANEEKYGASELCGMTDERKLLWLDVISKWEKRQLTKGALQGKLLSTTGEQKTGS